MHPLWHRDAVRKALAPKTETASTRFSAIAEAVAYAEAAGFGLPDYDESAATLVRERVLAFP